MVLAVLDYCLEIPIGEMSRTEKWHNNIEVS